MKEQISCGIVPIYIKDWQKYVLLVQWRHNHWWFPKWHIEKGELCIQTALREFQEETWIPADFIDVKEDKLIEDRYWFKLGDEKIFKIVRYFIWYLKHGFEKYLSPQQWEIYNVKLFNLSDAKKILEFKSLQNIIDKLMND